MAVANSNFEELLKEAGFSVADGEIDCGITYSKENLNILVEKMLEKTAAYMAEANAVISGLEKIEDKTSESYAQLSEMQHSSTSILQKFRNFLRKSAMESIK